MKLSISNIAWESSYDDLVYEKMLEYGFTGLEIAPTRIIPNNPYENLEMIKEWSDSLFKKYRLKVSSMQSIWYGRQEKIFGTRDEFRTLVNYTKMAIGFATTIGCKNLVFGCPRNRNTKCETDYKIAVDFFKEIGDYAFKHNTCIGMEANPSIYNTNFINDTLSAIKLIEEVSSLGFKLNLDLGTMIYNNETIELLKGKVNLINHVHVSEPYLKSIVVREIHKELFTFLMDEKYMNYISVEMEKVDEISKLEEVMKYVREVFI